MNSVYYTDKYLQTFYDLKGSTVGRDAKPGQAVKKDNDLRRGLPGEALRLPPTVRHTVRDQLKVDCDFLTDVGVMDYSMLVGVHHVPHSDDRSIATAGIPGNRSVRSMRKHDDDSSVGESSSNADDTLSSGPVISRPGSTGGADSTRNRLGSDVLHRRQLSDNIGNFFVENGLEEDDSSYLLGSEHRPKMKQTSSYHEDSERKKQVTVERLYWPFHRLFDIHGYRRLHPSKCPCCFQCPCGCHDDEDNKILVGYKIPKFAPPLSDRKDGGLEMDLSGLKLPLIYHGPQGPQPYKGKIFYMGIIDILQEYNSRKVLETQYRYMQTAGRPEASCVPPPDYASRFLGFFDEYTNPTQASDTGVELSIKGEVIPASPQK